MHYGMTVLVVVMAAGVAAGATSQVEHMNIALFSSGWNTSRVDQSIEGTTLRVNGTNFTHGVGTHADSLATISLFGDATRFRAMVGAG